MAHEDINPGAAKRTELSQGDYERLAAFRYVIRQFLGFSELAAHAAGLTPRQHQALLAIKGFPAGEGASIQDLADRLCVRHHSTVELVNRLVEARLVERVQDTADRRRVRLRLTEAADQRLAALSAIHLEELQRLWPALRSVLDAMGPAK